MRALQRADQRFSAACVGSIAIERSVDHRQGHADHLLGLLLVQAELSTDLTEI